MTILNWLMKRLIKRPDDKIIQKKIKARQKMIEWRIHALEKDLQKRDT